MDIYREIILDHYKHPRNFGTLDHPDSMAEEHNTTCGDKIRMEITMKDGELSDVKFSGVGCAISQAAASMLTEKVMDMSIEDIQKLNTESMTDMLGTSLTPSRVKCATLPLEVLQKAVALAKKNTPRV